MARRSNSITKLLRHRPNTDGSTPPPTLRNFYENNIPSGEECPTELVLDRLVKTVGYYRKKNAAFESRIESKLAPQPPQGGQGRFMKYAMGRGTSLALAPFHALFDQSLINATVGLLSFVGLAFIGDSVYDVNKQVTGVTADMAGELEETMMVRGIVNELRVRGLSEAGAQDK